MTRKYLVTGGTGFIGSHLVRALVQQGNEVRSFHRPGDPTLLIEGLPVERIEGDITDIETLTSAMRGCDGVFHTAGNLSFMRRDREVQRRVNVDGTRAVVEACRRAGVSRLVYTSTVNTLGIPDPPGTIGDESTPFNWDPLGFHYAITKHEAETIALGSRRPGFDVVAVNPGTVFGPGDLNMNAGSYIRAIASAPVFFYPDGGACCVHVDAVAAGHLAAMARGRSGERYILGGENLTYRQIFTSIAEVLGRQPPRVRLPHAAALAGAWGAETLSALRRRPGRLSAEAARCGRFLLFYSSAKAQRELAFPLIPFRSAVEDAVAWYRERGMLPA